MAAEQQDNQPLVTAAVLLIGDELLSGRTRDQNFHHIAELMTAKGIDVREARIVSDTEDEIVAALNDLRARYTYVFTTGGIGPTHDDITANAVARAFGVGIGVNEEALALLKARYKDREINEARLRMARTPHGATLVRNKVSAAPGFRIENVIVMAGVPAIMRAMLDAVAPELEGGIVMVSETVRTHALEGDLGVPLGAIQDNYGADVSIGSYPFFDNGVFGTQIVVRSRDRALLARAEADVRALVERLEAGGTGDKPWS